MLSEARARVSARFAQREVALTLVVMLLRLLVLGSALFFSATSSASAQSIVSSSTHTCALNAAGELYCWGMDVRKPGRRIRADSVPIPMVDTTRRFVSVGVGEMHDCAVMTNGQIACWGFSGPQGELARNTENCGVCGIDTIASPLRFRSVVVGQFHTCAIALDRRAYCWGANGSGQLGIGRLPAPYIRPTLVVGGHRWRSLVAGWTHTCGITTEGRTLCWGLDNSTAVSVPTPVKDTSHFAELFAGKARTCGLTGTGELHCWGGEFEDKYGKYQNGAGIIRTPVLIRASFAIQSLALGDGSSCVIAVGGDVYCWLESNFGTIGGAGIALSRARIASITDQPMNTPLKFMAISAYAGNACGIATDGGAYCWGRLDIPADKLPCRNPLSCTMLPVRIGGDLNLLEPARAKR